MAVRFYFDEDCMDQDLVHALRIRSVDVTTALEQDMVEQSDRSHLELATAQGRVLYSFNIGDYHHLHTEYLTEGKSHAGIIVAVQQRYTIGQQMRRLLKISATLSERDMQNRLVFLSNW